jgi:hypothetical protein
MFKNKESILEENELLMLLNTLAMREALTLSLEEIKSWVKK